MFLYFYILVGLILHKMILISCVIFLCLFAIWYFSYQFIPEMVRIIKSIFKQNLAV